MVLKITTSGVQEAKAQARKALQNMITDKFLTIGIHQDAGYHQGEIIPNAHLGAVLHFGDGANIPARPWLDVGVAKGNEEYIEMIKDGAAKGEALEDTLARIGVVAVGHVQEYIADLRTPPNAPSTIEQKGVDNPLIESGDMRRSVASKLTTGEPSEGL